MYLEGHGDLVIINGEDKESYYGILGLALEGPDLVSRLIIGIIGAIIWLEGVLNLFTKSMTLQLGLSRA